MHYYITDYKSALAVIEKLRPAPICNTFVRLAPICNRGLLYALYHGLQIRAIGHRKITACADLQYFCTAGADLQSGPFSMHYYITDYKSALSVIEKLRLAPICNRGPFYALYHGLQIRAIGYFRLRFPLFSPLANPVLPKKEKG
jgi:hypothetical protein